MQPEKAIDSSPRTAAAARPPAYTIGEEIANSVTHGIGVALSIAGLTLLVVFSSIYGDGWHVASSIVYGIALIVLYLASTLYHSIQAPRAKHWLKILDHSSIYVLIAGTYTPLTLVTLRDSGGWWLFGTIWGIALIGIAMETFWLYRPKLITALPYVVMGWLIVLRIGALARNMAPAGIWLLIAGGLAYTGGTIFYVLKKIPYFHAVWHLFVLAGSVLHFLTVILYVVPSAH
jgi:hemolysin III